MINNVVFGGNLTANPRKFGTEEKPAIGFDIAMNIPVRENGQWVDDVMYVSCVMFGKRVIKLAEILTKGMPVTVAGSIKPDRFTNKDGVIVNGMQVIVSDLQLPPRQQQPAQSIVDSAPWS